MNPRGGTGPVGGAAPAHPCARGIPFFLNTISEAGRDCSGIVQTMNNRAAQLLCFAKLKQSHRTSMCSLRYTVHPEHNRRETRLLQMRLPQVCMPQMHLPKTRLTLAMVLVLFLSACDSSQKAASEIPPLAVRVAQSNVQDVPLMVEMVGTTTGAQDVPIRTRVEGYVESMEFVEGTFVKKGDMLYTIDAQPFQAKLVAAQSELAGAQTHHVKTQSDLARIRPLAEINAVSEQDLDSTVAQEAAARASVKASEANVELAEIELSYTRIKAPIAGLIGLTKAKPGEFVGRDPNPVVLNMVSDIDPIHVRFSISEREYLILARHYRTRAGVADDVDTKRPANLTLLLADGTEHPELGSIIASAQAISAETGTYTLEASFPNPKRVLLPGQFARIRAQYRKIKDAVVIPRKAVIEMQGKFRVFTVNQQNQVEAVEIELGPATGNDVVVDSGLEGGETIIVEGFQKVRPGTQVNPQPVQD
jgi:membrane fusion protein (multidrug efflux system)